ncbi:hypothetical protein HZA98_00245 [Candidatus Woesearchaeota archaeon]|nr:hypothetical protein [Candidatus Woesearchaeota archaeon]
MQLQQLLLQVQELRHPSIPNALCGLEGMSEAHKVLQKKNSVGVLVGGLSEAVWNQRRTQEELQAHKDVDVLVLDYDSGINRFEGGIDWWLPRKERVIVKDIYGDREGPVEFYQNGNGVILSFGAKNLYDISLQAGLYILEPESVVTMRVYEAQAHIDFTLVHVEDEVFDAFRNKVRKRMGNSLMRDVREYFKDYILSDKYDGGSNYIDFEEFDIATIGALSQFK